MLLQYYGNILMLLKHGNIITLMLWQLHYVTLPLYNYIAILQYSNIITLL